MATSNSPILNFLSCWVRFLSLLDFCGLDLHKFFVWPEYFEVQSHNGRLLMTGGSPGATVFSYHSHVNVHTNDTVP